jgi:hypothetical protein
LPNFCGAPIFCFFEFGKVGDGTRLFLKVVSIFMAVKMKDQQQLAVFAPPPQSELNQISFKYMIF